MDPKGCRIRKNKREPSLEPCGTLGQISAMKDDF